MNRSHSRRRFLSAALLAMACVGCTPASTGPLEPLDLPAGTHVLLEQIAGPGLDGGYEVEIDNNGALVGSTHFGDDLYEVKMARLGITIPVTGQPPFRVETTSGTLLWEDPNGTASGYIINPGGNRIAYFDSTGTILFLRDLRTGELKGQMTTNGLAVQMMRSDGGAVFLFNPEDPSFPPAVKVKDFATGTLRNVNIRPGCFPTSFSSADRVALYCEVTGQSPVRLWESGTSDFTGLLYNSISYDGARECGQLAYVSKTVLVRGSCAEWQVRPDPVYGLETVWVPIPGSTVRLYRDTATPTFRDLATPPTGQQWAAYSTTLPMLVPA